jgi:mRNA-degrading endonuclease RelE of RelBE toxin-antitoxin system
VSREAARPSGLALGLSKPQYRLRVGDVRVFYDVSESTVEVLAIVLKAEAASWLIQFGSPE